MIHFHVVSPPVLSPLTRLVLFFFCLAIAASILATVHYLVIDLPAQKNLPPPENAASSISNCNICKHNCKADADYYYRLAVCEDLACCGDNPW